MIKFDVRQSPVIVKAIIQDGRLYQMEYKEHHNSLIYIILKLHNMGVSNDQLLKMYNHIVKQMNPLLMPKESKISTPININDWQDYLGDTQMYSAYLHFFDREITIHGVDHTIKQFFHKSPLSQSIGSQRLPTVHLALGVQHGLSEVTAQALAYMATTYQDTSFLLDQPSELCNTGYLTAHETLMEQVRVDPRFSSFPLTPSLGYHEAQNHPDNNQITYRKITKNTKELLRTYVYLWHVPEHVKDAINELRILSAHMMIKPVKSSNGLRKYHVDLTTGGNLLNTFNAMETLYPNHTCPKPLIRVLFLNLICSYIVQGRPDILRYNHHKLKQQQQQKKDHKHVHEKEVDKKKYTCPKTLIQKILEKKEKDQDIKKIAALACVQEAMQDNHHHRHLFEKLIKNIYLQ